MRLGVTARLGIFAVGLAAVFGGAAALGAAVDPGHPAARQEMSTMKGMDEAMGVVANDGSYAITPASFQATPGRSGTLSFTIVDHKGNVVRDGFEIEAERRLHLIVVRQDLTGYQHLHPTEAGDGTWSTPLTLDRAGTYRIYADFQRGGVKHVLAADLNAAGMYAPEPLPAPTPVTATEGFEVALEHAPLRAGKEADLDFTVSRHGRPVEAVEPYLGARGHLVALRQGDLAYLHVHPHEGHQQAGVVPFAADFMSAGSYRLFLQFQVAGVVHTAAFTVEVSP
jgi:plastocyanin